MASIKDILKKGVGLVVGILPAINEILPIGDLLLKVLKIRTADRDVPKILDAIDATDEAFAAVEDVVREAREALVVVKAGFDAEGPSGDDLDFNEMKAALEELDDIPLAGQIAGEKIKVAIDKLKSLT